MRVHATSGALQTTRDDYGFAASMFGTIWVTLRRGVLAEDVPPAAVGSYLDDPVRRPRSAEGEGGAVDGVHPSTARVTGHRDQDVTGSCAPQGCCNIGHLRDGGPVIWAA